MKKDIIVNNLFDDKKLTADKEAKQLDKLKELDNKIAGAVNKVRALKEEKMRLETKVTELEGQLSKKDRELAGITSDNLEIKNQLRELLNELDTLALG